MTTGAGRGIARGLIVFTSASGAVHDVYGPACGAHKAGIDKLAADRAAISASTAFCRAQSQNAILAWFIQGFLSWRLSPSNEEATMQIGSLSLGDAPQAIELLKADHREVEALFKQFENTTDDREKVALASAICHALTVHAEIEEQIFYPESRRVLGKGDQDQVDEAVVEHASLKQLMADLDGMKAGDDLFEARVTVLKEYVQHHVKEEENEFFPKVARAGLDQKKVCERLQAMKDQLIDANPPMLVGDTVSFPVLSSGAVSKKPRTLAAARAA
ncbi:hemerythrin domain-containing protein [Solimonas soli]|uniref:hemerythrin domain-containing protein n=1 Tax=Solimonas soli TaxID=413479 RepID=UPI001B7FA4E4|nr:hemerythrin domain-containing protein [Solimonas soli]